MNFESALMLLRVDKGIKRKNLSPICFNNTKEFFYCEDSDKEYTFTTEDIIATDWEVCDPYIRPGQIWQTKDGKKFVVTRVYYDEQRDVIIYSRVYQNGDTISDNNKKVFNKLIVIYPNWKDAIHSNHFEND